MPQKISYAREWREALGFSLDEMAKKIGEEYYFVQGRETGRRKTLLVDMLAFQNGFKFDWKLLLVPPPPGLKQFVKSLRDTRGEVAVDELLEIIAYIAAPPPVEMRRNDINDG